MKRTKLRDRILPKYSKGEEIMNMVTHIVGGALGITVLVLCVIRSALHGNLTGLLTSIFYGVTMIATYTMSSVYHGLHPGTGKKVLQVIDHCAIYSLIAGSYTPIVLAAIAPRYPVIGWGLFAAEWALAALATTLTAIDLKQYKVFSMICYICMGWGIALFFPQTWEVLGANGFYLLLAGCISYTVGAILFGIGKKMPWMHAVFHIFVVLGSALQFLAIYFYVI